MNIPSFNSNRNYEVFWEMLSEKRAFNARFGDARAYIDYMRATSFYFVPFALQFSFS